MQSSRNFHLFLLVVICFFTFFIHNKVVYPDIMESRNLVTAREMVEYDNWLVPTMNGELRMEKPPLPTWVAGAIERVSPDNILLQRMAAGLVASLLIFFMYFLGTGMTKKPLYGLISALVLCTSFNIILMGRTATWDIYCHSFMLGAIYFFYRAFKSEGAHWRDFLWSGVFMGLSFLGKGPVSFYALLLPFLLCYFPIYRPSAKGKIIPLLVMILICLIISLWWPVYLYVYHKDMAVLVAAKESTAWLERNVRPWYYYWKFFLESGIWSLFLVTSLLWPYWKKRITLKKEYILVVSWTFAILILLSLLPEKKTRYLLPILIPSAMVVAHIFLYGYEKWSKGSLPGWDKLFFRINSLLVALIVSFLPIGIYVLFYRKGDIGLGWFIFSSVLFLITAVILFMSALKLRPLRFLGGVVFLFFIVEAFLMPSIADLFNNPDIKSIHAVREIDTLKEIPFYYPEEEGLRIELVYEAGRRILPWDVKSDTLPALPMVLVSGKRAEEILPDSLQAGIEMELIGIFDDNRRKANTKWHSGIFVRHVTLLKAKNWNKRPYQSACINK